MGPLNKRKLWGEGLFFVADESTLRAPVSVWDLCVCTCVFVLVELQDFNTCWTTRGLIFEIHSPIFLLFWGISWGKKSKIEFFERNWIFLLNPPIKKMPEALCTLKSPSFPPSFLHPLFIFPSFLPRSSHPLSHLSLCPSLPSPLALSTPSCPSSRWHSGAPTGALPCECYGGLTAVPPPASPSSSSSLPRHHPAQSQPQW